MNKYKLLNDLIEYIIKMSKDLVSTDKYNLILNKENFDSRYKTYKITIYEKDFKAFKGSEE